MNTRHLLTLSEAFWWKEVVPQIDEAVRQRVGPREYERYLKDPERPALLQALRTHEIGGRRDRGLARRDHRPARWQAPGRSPRCCTAAWEKNRPRSGGRRRTWAERAPQSGAGARSPRPSGCWISARPSSAASSPSGRRSGRSRRGVFLPRSRSRRRGERTGKSRPASWAPTARRPGSPTRRRRSGRRPRTRLSSGRRSTLPCRALQLPDNEALLRAMGRGEHRGADRPVPPGGSCRARRTSARNWPRPNGSTVSRPRRPRPRGKPETRPRRPRPASSPRCTARSWPDCGSPTRRGGNGPRQPRRPKPRPATPPGAARPRPGRADPGHGRRGGRRFGGAARDARDRPGDVGPDEGRAGRPGRRRAAGPGRGLGEPDPGDRCGDRQVRRQRGGRARAGSRG